MDSFNARTVMAARIARECPAALRPPGEPVAAAPRPVAGRAPGPALANVEPRGPETPFHLRIAWARANGGL
jgi:hypothetical protein